MYHLIIYRQVKRKEKKRKEYKQNAKIEKYNKKETT